MRLHLIRHPLPLVEEGICYGRSDLALRFPAEETAALLRARLQGLLENVPLFSSPLRRCLELAKALHPAPRIDARLQELHFGRWEMQTWEAIGFEALNEWAADPLGFVPPGGESVNAMKARLDDFLAEVGPHHEEVILVTHAGVIKTLIGKSENSSAQAWLSASVDYGSLTLLTL